MILVSFLAQRRNVCIHMSEVWLLFGVLYWLCVSRDMRKENTTSAIIELFKFLKYNSRLETRFRCSAITSHSQYNLFSCLACDFCSRVYISETTCNRRKKTTTNERTRKRIIKKTTEQEHQSSAIPLLSERHFSFDYFFLVSLCETD